MTEPAPNKEPQREATLLEMLAAIIAVSPSGHVEWELKAETYGCIDANGAMHGATGQKGVYSIFDITGGTSTQLWSAALGGCGACGHTAGTYIPDGKKMVRGFKY